MGENCEEFIKLPIELRKRLLYNNGRMNASFDISIKTITRRGIYEKSTI